MDVSTPQTITNWKKQVVAIIDGGENHLVMNCAGLTYVSSSGLRVLLMALKKVTANGGKLRICALQPNIMEIFEIAGFTSIFSVVPTVEDAAK